MDYGHIEIPSMQNSDQKTKQKKSTWWLWSPEKEPHVLFATVPLGHEGRGNRM